MRKILFSLLSVVFLVAVGLFAWLFFWPGEEVKPILPIQEENVQPSPADDTALPVLEESPVAFQPREEVFENTQEEIIISQTILHTVPFTSQAPFSEWSDPVYQNGCEEASLLMAERWLSEGFFDRESAKLEIAALSKRAEKLYGKGTLDTSAQDTARLFREFYGRDMVTLTENVQVRDIIEALTKDALVIIPADGRALNNPHFQTPGPAYHMLVIIGYDPETKEFITNDPGTRQGAGFRYPEEMLFTAMRDYPTGHHEPIVGIKKTMLVIGRAE